MLRVRMIMPRKFIAALLVIIIQLATFTTQEPFGTETAMMLLGSGGGVRERVFLELLSSMLPRILLYIDNILVNFFDMTLPCTIYTISPLTAKCTKIQSPS